MCVGRKLMKVERNIKKRRRRTKRRRILLSIQEVFIIQGTGRGCRAQYLQNPLYDAHRGQGTQRSHQEAALVL